MKKTLLELLLLGFYIFLNNYSYIFCLCIHLYKTEKL